MWSWPWRLKIYFTFLSKKNGGGKKTDYTTQKEYRQNLFRDPIHKADMESSIFPLKGNGLKRNFIRSLLFNVMDYDQPQPCYVAEASKKEHKSPVFHNYRPCTTTPVAQWHIIVPSSRWHPREGRSIPSPLPYPPPLLMTKK